MGDDLYLKLDISELEALGRDLSKLESQIKQAASALSAQTHAHVVEQAQLRLHSRRQKFIDNLAFEQVSDDTWVVVIKEPATWIEDGMPAHSMVDDLLGDNPKTAKDGSKYRVIPFEHNKGPTTQTSAQQSLTQTVKAEMKKMKIPWAKIERDEKGRVKQGLLHKFDIEDQPTKKGFGRGQGHGEVGEVMQGNTGIPFLRGVRIYQKALFNDDGSPRLNKKGEHMGARNIMTFRVVSSKHKGEKWNYPGIEGMHFLDEALNWAQKEWEDRIMPDLLKAADLL
jgi:hypothetical protein